MDKKALLDIFLQKDLTTLSTEEVSDIYHILDEFNSYIYRFVLSYYKYMYTTQEYLPGISFSMMEVHIITDIAQHPGIYASTLSKKWNCTPAYISRILKHLEQQGYICREPNKDNHRFYHLYITEKGQEVDLAHKKYDILSIVKTNSMLLQQFHLEDLILLRNILQEYSKDIDPFPPLEDSHV